MSGLEDILKSVIGDVIGIKMQQMTAEEAKQISPLAKRLVEHLDVIKKSCEMLAKDGNDLFDFTKSQEGLSEDDRITFMIHQGVLISITNQLVFAGDRIHDFVRDMVTEHFQQLEEAEDNGVQ